MLLNWEKELESTNLILGKMNGWVAWGNIITVLQAKLQLLLHDLGYSAANNFFFFFLKSLGLALSGNFQAFYVQLSGQIAL